MAEVSKCAEEPGSGTWKLEGQDRVEEMDGGMDRRADELGKASMVQLLARGVRLWADDIYSKRALHHKRKGRHGAR